MVTAHRSEGQCGCPTGSPPVVVSALTANPGLCHNQTPGRSRQCGRRAAPIAPQQRATEVEAPYPGCRAEIARRVSPAPIAAVYEPAEFPAGANDVLTRTPYRCAVSALAEMGAPSGILLASVQTSEDRANTGMWYSPVARLVLIRHEVTIRFAPRHALYRFNHRAQIRTKPEPASHASDSKPSWLLTYRRCLTMHSRWT
jgi:hypothetical protein